MGQNWLVYWNGRHVFRPWRAGDGCDDTTILRGNYMWAVTYTFCIYIKSRATSALTIHWVFLHLAEPIRVAWHSCTVFHQPLTLACSLRTPSWKIYKKRQKSTISHISTYFSAVISHAALLYSTTLMFLVVNKAILEFPASFFYEVIHNTNRHVSTWFIFYLHTPNHILSYDWPPRRRARLAVHVTCRARQVDLLVRPPS